MMLLKKYLFLSEFLCKIKVHDKVSGCIRFYCPDTPGNTVRIIRKYAPGERWKIEFADNDVRIEKFRSDEYLQ